MMTTRYNKYVKVMKETRTVLAVKSNVALLILINPIIEAVEQEVAGVVDIGRRDSWSVSWFDDDMNSVEVLFTPSDLKLNPDAFLDKVIRPYIKD